MPGPVAPAVRTPAVCPSAATGPWAVVARGWRGFVWYVKAVLGESDYERYVAHLTRHHPEAPVPTVREYWRERYAFEAHHPEGHCC